MCIPPTMCYSFFNFKMYSLKTIYVYSVSFYLSIQTLPSNSLPSYLPLKFIMCFGNFYFFLHPLSLVYMHTNMGNPQYPHSWREFDSPCSSSHQSIPPWALGDPPFLHGGSLLLVCAGLQSYWVQLILCVMWNDYSLTPQCLKLPWSEMKIKLNTTEGRTSTNNRGPKRGQESGRESCESVSDWQKPHGGSGSGQVRNLISILIK